MPPGFPLITVAILLSICGAVLVVGGVLTWYNHAFPEQKNDRLRPFVSPDGTRQAVLFRRTSLGPADFTTHVGIIATGAKLPNRSGTVFIAIGQPEVTVRWVDDHHLIIHEAEGAEVILRASQVGNMRISEE